MAAVAAPPPPPRPGGRVAPPAGGSPAAQAGRLRTCSLAWSRPQLPADRAGGGRSGRWHRQVLAVPPVGHQILVPGRRRILALPARVNALGDSPAAPGPADDHAPTGAGGRYRQTVRGIDRPRVATRRSRSVAERGHLGQRRELPA